MNEIITKENYQSIAEIIATAKDMAKLNAEKGPNMNYAYERIHIVGHDLFMRFCEDRGIDYKSLYFGCYGHSELRNKSSIAKVETIYTVEYHYDGSTKTETWSNISKGSYVLVDGEILNASFYNSKTTADFSFFQDYRKYSDRLPNSWLIENPAPERVGVMTDKKVQAWLDWLRQRRDLYNEIENERNAKVAKFLESVRSAADKCSEVNIGETSGSLRSNNLVFTYQISDGGYIYPQIKVDHRGETSLNTFMQMIAGSYGK